VHSSGRLRSRSERWRGASTTSARTLATLSLGDAAPSGEASAAVASAPMLLRPPRGGLESAVVEQRHRSLRELQRSRSPRCVTERERRQDPGRRRRRAPRHRFERVLSLPLECTELLHRGNCIYLGPTRNSKWAWPGLAWVARGWDRPQVTGSGAGTTGDAQPLPGTPPTPATRT
jgi:hypothetical protein